MASYIGIANSGIFLGGILGCPTCSFAGDDVGSDRIFTKQLMVQALSAVSDSLKISEMPTIKQNTCSAIATFILGLANKPIDALVG